MKSGFSFNLSTNYVRLFVDIPPSMTVSYFRQKLKGRSSRKEKMLEVFW
ncbi:MAG: transposase [Betaproteobacteria bacterium]|nr:transposase [Betaproteobacteria bacterium]